MNRLTSAALAATMVLITASATIALAYSGSIIMEAYSAESSGGCVWTKAREDTVMGFLGVVYGDAIEDYSVESVRLISYDEAPPYCKFRLTLKNEQTGAVLEINVFWMFSKFVGFTLYSLPVEPVAALNLGDPLRNDTAALSREALVTIDDLVERVLNAVDVPDLVGRDLSLAGAVHGGELVLDERPFGRQRNSPVKDFAMTVSLGAGVTARVMYKWDEQGHQDITIEYYRVYDIGLNMTTKYRLLFISFSRSGQGWIVYSIHFVPYPVTFRRIEVPPDAYIKEAEEAVAKELGGSCRVINSSYQRIEYMLPPKEVNRSIYFSKPAYHYLITLNCGQWVWGYTALVNAVDGQVIHISPAGTKNAPTNNVDNSPAPQVMYGVGVPVIASAIAVLAFAVLRRWARAGR